MRRLDVQIPAPDGHSNGTLHVPDGDGRWPGVLVFPDAGGVRETFRQMGDRLAGMGYVALIPDIYYRAGGRAPFDVATVFRDKQERARLTSLARVLTNDRIIADAGAYSGFVLARPEVTGSTIGTTGYCLGGRMSLIAAVLQEYRQMDQLPTEMNTLTGVAEPAKLQMLVRVGRTNQPGLSPRRDLSAIAQPR